MRDRTFRRIRVAVLALVVQTLAFGQIGEQLKLGPPPPGTFTIPLPAVIPGEISNFSGVVFTIHSIDTSEVDVTLVGSQFPGGGVSFTHDGGTFQRYSFWISPGSANSSGRNISIFGGPTALGLQHYLNGWSLDVQPLGTSIGQNSDTDFSITARVIQHLHGEQPSNDADLFWPDWDGATNPGAPLSAAPGPIESSFQYFQAVRIPFVDLAGTPLSVQFGTTGPTLYYGIEHDGHVIPEPGSFALMGGGLLLLGFGLKMRRDRRKQAGS